MDDPSVSLQANPMAEPKSRRRRPPVSCTLCRKRKIKCNREYPCSNCLRSKKNRCVYESLSPPPRQRLRHGQTTAPDRAREPEERQTLSLDQGSTVSSDTTAQTLQSGQLVASSTAPSTPGSQSSAREVESLRFRIKQLEEQLSKATRRPVTSTDASSDTNITTIKSYLAGTFHVHHQRPAAGQDATIPRTIMHKTRLFGQSHWMNGTAQFWDVLETIEPCVQNENSKCFLNVHKCKYLARVIKSRQNPTWPTPPTTDLPAKDVADSLVDIYLRTIEGIHRILHIPTFRQDYEAVWVSETTPDMAFIIQLKLVLSIGAVMYDDRFSLRTSAIRWIYEAQTWISQPEFKSRLNVQFLQTSILLLFAREFVGVEGGLSWVSAGNVMRTAVYMGLHRDPLYFPKSTTFVAEMRRRVWNTVLEINLQTSMNSGGPPLFSLDDFDTQPPGNFDDEQIMAEDPTPQPDGSFTQMSIALALRKMFPVRLAIAKALNGIGVSSAYNETLRLDSELRRLYKAICRMIQQYSSGGGNSPSQFQIRTLDYLVRRYFLALHEPFFAPATHETAYAFSRKVVVDTSLKMWCAVYPSSPIMAAASQTEFLPAHSDYLTRLAFCGSGLFRTISAQACLLIAAELRAQLQEEDSLGPVPLRRDLLSVLDDGRKWALRSIEVGQVNVKGYLFLSVICEQVGGLMRGLPESQFPELLTKAAEDVLERCVSILEDRVSQGKGEEDIGIHLDGIDDIPADTLPDLIGDWSFMMPVNNFDFGITEPINWVESGFT
ncbi:hypothetical protein AWENTII_009491 [Aspergillus wentii]